MRHMNTFRGVSDEYKCNYPSPAGSAIALFCHRRCLTYFERAYTRDSIYRLLSGNKASVTDIVSGVVVRLVDDR